jgi:hypothetical protein
MFPGLTNRRRILPAKFARGEQVQQPNNQPVVSLPAPWLGLLDPHCNGRPKSFPTQAVFVGLHGFALEGLDYIHGLFKSPASAVVLPAEAIVDKISSAIIRRS